MHKRSKIRRKQNATRNLNVKLDFEPFQIQCTPKLIQELNMTAFLGTTSAEELELRSLYISQYICTSSLPLVPHVKVAGRR